MVWGSVFVVHPIYKCVVHKTPIMYIFQSNLSNLSSTFAASGGQRILQAMKMKHTGDWSVQISIYATLYQCGRNADYELFLQTFPWAALVRDKPYVQWQLQL